MVGILKIAEVSEKQICTPHASQYEKKKTLEKLMWDNGGPTPAGWWIVG